MRWQLGFQHRLRGYSNLTRISIAEAYGLWRRLLSWNFRADQKMISVQCPKIDVARYLEFKCQAYLYDLTERCFQDHFLQPMLHSFYLNPAEPILAGQLKTDLIHCNPLGWAALFLWVDRAAIRVSSRFSRGFQEFFSLRLLDQFARVITSHCDTWHLRLNFYL